MRTYTPAGQLIRTARQAAGMSQQEMAHAAGLAPGRISDYERGKLDPSTSMLLRVLNAADMSLRLVPIDDSDLLVPDSNGRVLEDVLSFADALEH